MAVMTVSPSTKELDNIEKIIIDVLANESQPIEIYELLAKVIEKDIMAEFEFRSSILHLLSKGIVMLDNQRKVSIFEP
jgi:hypothetical protein